MMIILQRLVLLCIVICLLNACSDSGKKELATASIDSNATINNNELLNADSATMKTAMEQKMIDTIFKLPEIVERSAYIDKETKGLRHLKVWIYATPDKNELDYYWVKAGEDNGNSLVTHFDFHIYPNSGKILYYEPVHDTLLTLDQWRTGEIK